MAITTPDILFPGHIRLLVNKSYFYHGSR